MNDANIAIYDVNARTAGNITNPSVFDSRTDWQVREEKEFYIPNLLTEEQYDARPEAHFLAGEHAKHLYKAQGLIGDALNLTALLRASLADECDARAMQAESALSVIEKKLSKAHKRIDAHDKRHTKLFLAYFDLFDKAENK